MATFYAKPNQSIIGTKFADEIQLNGRGTAYGLGGDDEIYDGFGNNKIYGGDGNDFVDVNEGRDSVWGGRGDDFLTAQYNGDGVTLRGDAGDDFLFGGFGNDFLDGGAGNDGIFGNGGQDTARGGTGDDTFYFGGIHGEVYDGITKFDGGAGQDTLAVNIDANPEVWITGEGKGYLTTQEFGSAHSETKLTFTGTNVITTNDTSEPVPLIYHGGNSDNTVIGSLRDDTFIGGQGNEIFSGLSGADNYVFDFRPFDPKHAKDLPMGHDTITDFDLDPEWGVDHFAFRGGEGQFTTTQVEHDGMTTYTSTDLAGHTLHVLDVLAVGLPPIEHDILV